MCLRFSYLKCLLVNAKNSCLLVNHDVCIVFTERFVGSKLIFGRQLSHPGFPHCHVVEVVGSAGLQACSVAWVLLLHAGVIKWIAFPHCRKMVENLQSAFQSVAVYSRQITCLRARGMATCECVDDVSFKLKLSYNRLGQNGGIIIFMVPVCHHQINLLILSALSESSELDAFFPSKICQILCLLNRSNCCSTSSSTTAWCRILLLAPSNKSGKRRHPY